MPSEIQGALVPALVQVDLAGDERRGGVLEGQAGVRGLGKLAVFGIDPRRVVREEVLGEGGEGDVEIGGRLAPCCDHVLHWGRSASTPCEALRAANLPWSQFGPLSQTLGRSARHHGAATNR